MISTSQLRVELFNLWKDMPKSGRQITVYHRRKVYKLTIEPTTKKLGGYKKSLKPSDIPKTTCPKCGFIRLGGICLNKC